MLRGQLPVRQVRITGDLPGETWPTTIPAVAQLARDGLVLGAATVLVGENGTGKSTLIEAIAAAYGLNPEGGTGHARHATRPTESPLAEALTLTRGIGTPRHGFFLRAETILELDDEGWRTSSWRDTALVGHHHRFLDDPAIYLRHLGDP